MRSGILLWLRQETVTCAGAKQTAEKMRLIMVREEREAGKLYNPTENEDRLSQSLLPESWPWPRSWPRLLLFRPVPAGPCREEANQTIKLVIAFVDADQPLRPDLASMPLASAALAQATLGKTTLARVTFTRALKIARSLQLCPGSEIMAQVAERQWKAGQEADARICTPGGLRAVQATVYELSSGLRSHHRDSDEGRRPRRCSSNRACLS